MDSLETQVRAPMWRVRGLRNFIDPRNGFPDSLPMATLGNYSVLANNIRSRLLHEYGHYRKAITGVEVPARKCSS